MPEALDLVTFVVAVAIGGGVVIVLIALIVGMLVTRVEKRGHDGL